MSSLKASLFKMAVGYACTKLEPHFKNTFFLFFRISYGRLVEKIADKILLT